jgi:hypothetical protein
MITDAQYKEAKIWLKTNRKVVKKMAGQWIAYSQEGIYAHGEDQGEVVKTVRATGKDFILRYLHPTSFIDKPRLLPVRFRSLKSHQWEPLYLITLQTKRENLTLEMLVDSGADFSAIGYQTGIDLGLQLTDNERILSADGVNGSVKYVERMVQIKIDDYSFDAPIGWILDEKCDDVLLGREVVFDLFDVEFKQADEEIIFKKRSSVS